MCRIPFVALLLMVSIISGAQTGLVFNEKKAVQLKKLAKEAERTGEMYLALEYYKQMITLEPDNLKYQFNIAHLYRYTRNYTEAEKYYDEVCKKGVEEYPEALFYCAIMQKANGNYKVAKENLIKFKKRAEEVKDKRIKKRSKTELEGCDFAMATQDTIHSAVVTALSSEINHPHVDFSPIPLSDNEFIFGSLREKSAPFYDVQSVDTMHLPVRKFYLAEKNGNDWKMKGEWEGPFNTKEENIGNGTFSLDRNQFYFTRCAPNWQYKTICKIYCSEKKDNRWQEPYLMDDQLNLSGYTSSHPTIGRESKKNQEVLYFVSDRPGSKGGMDIWYSEYDGRKHLFKTPKNAGSKINTVGTEATPFYDVKTKTLYYSTDGKINIGGLDIYKASGERNKWEPSVNLGFPINSSADDLDFALRPDAKGGLMVSNRIGGQSLYNPTCCDDIYEFTYTDFITLLFTGEITDKQSKDCVDSVTLSIYIFNGVEKYFSEELPITNCNYQLQLQPGINYLLETSKNGYFNNSFATSTKNFNKSDTIKHNITIEKIPIQPIVIPQLNYEFNSTRLTPDSKAILDTTVLLLLKKNPNLVIELSSHTDNKGSDEYNEQLSQKRAEILVKYLLNKGINNNQLIAKGYGEKNPLAPNENEDGSDNPEGRQLNRRVEIKVVGKIDFTSIHRETIEENKARRKEKEDEDAEEE